MFQYVSVPLLCSPTGSFQRKRWNRPPTKKSSPKDLPRIPRRELLYGILPRPTAVISKGIFDRKQMGRRRHHSRPWKSCRNSLPDGTDTTSLGSHRSGAPDDVAPSRNALNAGQSLGIRITLPYLMTHRGTLTRMYLDRAKATATRKQRITRFFTFKYTMVISCYYFF